MNNNFAFHFTGNSSQNQIAQGLIQYNYANSKSK